VSSLRSKNQRIRVLSIGVAKTFDPVRVGVLQLAVEHGPLRAGEVAERLTALTDAGLLRTQADPTDRRAVLLEATAAGRAELRQFLDVGAQAFGAVIVDWSEADVVTLTGLLQRLIESWAAHGAARDRRPRTGQWSAEGRGQRGGLRMRPPPH
jgi:hypothetical protein